MLLRWKAVNIRTFGNFVQGSSFRSYTIVWNYSYYLSYIQTNYINVRGFIYSAITPLSDNNKNFMIPKD